AGQRRDAERQDVGPPVYVLEARRIALEHLHVRQQMVSEQHGLRALQVGIAGHDALALALRRLEQRADQLDEAADSLDEGIARKEARIGGDLVVAAARGVQSQRWLADALVQLRLDQRMDVLVGSIECGWLMQQRT